MLLIGWETMGSSGSWRGLPRQEIYYYGSALETGTKSFNMELTPLKQSNEASNAEGNVNEISFQFGIVVDLDKQRGQRGLSTAVYHVVYAVAEQHNAYVL